MLLTESTESTENKVSTELAGVLARYLYYTLPEEEAIKKADTIKATDMQARHIIHWVVNHPMVSEEGVANHIKTELGLA
jgi:hypothetical protein